MMRVSTIGPDLRKLAMGAAYMAAVLGLAAVARDHFGPPLAMAPWNPATALAFVLVARLGLSWLGVALAIPFVAQFLIGGSSEDLALRLTETALASAAGLALHDREGFALDLARLRPLLSFFGLAAATGAAVAVAHAAAASGQGGDALAAAMRAFFANTAAIVLVCPALLLHDPRRWQERAPVPTLETALQVLALGIVGWEVFARFHDGETHFFYLLFLPLAWIATRHGQRGVSLALAAAFTVALVTDALFGHSEGLIPHLQSRLVALAVVGLLLGTLVRERHEVNTRMLARHSDLAHAQRLNVGREMASALAHEVNQPLTAAMNYAQAAQRLLAAPTPDVGRASDILAKGIDRIERASQIVHGMRDFMRKGEARPVRMSLAEAVEDALTLVSAEANAAGVLLHAGSLSSLPEVVADKTQLVQVLVNLVRNAIQAVGMGGTVAISGHVAGAMVELAVADDGPGIDPAVARRLFEPFVTTKEAGMGLGLSISKSIMETHGGGLWAEPGPGGGTVFRFTLPLADKEQPADA